MFRLALNSARTRPSAFIGALLAFAMSGVLAMAGGMLLQAALSTHPPVERYSGAAAVVTGQQVVGSDHDVVLSERARVSDALVGRLAAVPGIRAAVADVSVPAQFGSRAVQARGWSSARLTPYALAAGRAPAGPAEVVTGFHAKLGSHLRLASTEAVRTVTVVGVARARTRHSVRMPSLFMTDS